MVVKLVVKVRGGWSLRDASGNHYYDMRAEVAQRMRLDALRMGASGCLGNYYSYCNEAPKALIHLPTSVRGRRGKTRFKDKPKRLRIR